MTKRRETSKARRENWNKPCKSLTEEKFEEGVFQLGAGLKRYRVFCKRLLPARIKGFVYSLEVNRNHWILLSHPSSQVKKICKISNLWQPLEMKVTCQI